jgi:hypothetical protein
VLKTLNGLAASSEDRTALRRNNFKRLAKVFGKRLEVSAEALDMRNGSIVEVADGRLHLDDERFGHLNPRLMLAGFPNGWPNEAEPQLPCEFMESLAKLAEAEPENNCVAASAVPVMQAPVVHSPPPASALAPTTSHTAAVNEAPSSDSTATLFLSSAKPGASFGSISRDLKGAAAPVKANTNPLENSPVSTAKKNQSAPAAGQGLKGAKPIPSSGGARNLPRGARCRLGAVGSPCSVVKKASWLLQAPAAFSLSAILLGKSLAGAPALSSATAQPDLSNSTKEALGNPELGAVVRQARKRTERGNELTR